MGRSPCCDDVGVKKGPWTPEEDKMLVDYIQKHGHGSWRQLPKLAGLNRCGKSCRLRWSNYLRPDIKRGKFEEDEERLIIHLHSILGNKWSAIATRLPGRTDNEIKNYWNTHLRKKLLKMGIDPVTHQPRTDLNLLAGLPNLLASTANLGNLASYWDNLSLLQARFQLSQNIIQILASSSSTPKMDPIQSLLGSSSLLRNNQFSDLIQFKRQLEGLFTGSLGLTQDSMPNLEIPQQASSFQACMDSIHSSEGQQMVAPISGSCIINGSSVDQAANSYVIPTTNSSVPLVSTSPENIAMDQMQEPNNSSDISVSSPTSDPFEAWEGLKLDDMDSELCWKDILDQISQSNASQSMEQSQL